MGHRGRLCVAAVLASLVTLTVGFLVAVPVVRMLQDRLQARYDAANTGPPEAVRVVGDEYVGAAFSILVAFAVVVFCAGAVHVSLTTPPSRRGLVHRDLGRLGAALLVAQAPLSIAAGVWGPYSSAATVGGAALGAAGVLVLVLDRAPVWAYACGCAVAAASTLTAVASAVLLIPLVVGLAGILVAAAVTAVIEAVRRAVRTSA
ncbi:hypothetical protein [Blastococcus mobilis]|nr:hypothetical protein [Blastococcus mobilis]